MTITRIGIYCRQAFFLSAVVTFAACANSPAADGGGQGGSGGSSSASSHGGAGGANSGGANTGGTNTGGTVTFSGAIYVNGGTVLTAAERQHPVGALFVGLHENAGGSSTVPGVENRHRRHPSFVPMIADNTWWSATPEPLRRAAVQLQLIRSQISLPVPSGDASTA